jgi:hypothetical protein
MARDKAAMIEQVKAWAARSLAIDVGIRVVRLECAFEDMITWLENVRPRSKEAHEILEAAKRELALSRASNAEDEA